MYKKAQVKNKYKTKMKTKSINKYNHKNRK